MKKLAFTAFILCMLSACAGWGGARLTPGMPEAAVRAALGAPTGVYRDGGDTVLEYASGPAGQATWMARLDPAGRLASYEQVLASEKFAQVKVGKDNKETILRTFGRPADQARYALKHQDAWIYRYKEQGVWNSLMYVEFGPNGTVEALMNGPDPEREPRRGW